MLGELTFGGANGGQIEKFHLGWKVDRQTFPTRTLGVNVDTGKAFKSGSKQVLRIEKSGAAHRENFVSLTKYTLFFT